MRSASTETMKAGQGADASRTAHADALKAAREWDSGDGVLAAFATNPVLDCEAKRERLLDEIDRCLADADDRALGHDDDPVWKLDASRLRALRELLTHLPVRAPSPDPAPGM